MTADDRTAPSRPPSRPLLWTLLVVALAANAGLSLAALPVAAAVPGLLVLVTGALLVRDHRRRARARP
ncbi:hypothetical protein [Pseudonocardia sp. ICBG601]|uniref:hypothetical protein n=1 Tax=Pseudonocardia sp. ICBG601 TaxID=2846759 RepID=UPI001CF625A5|nr:hypothetical protein [Pseudonocardia sp. ICBG601]